MRFTSSIALVAAFATFGCTADESQEGAESSATDSVDDEGDDDDDNETSGSDSMDSADDATQTGGNSDSDDTDDSAGESTGDEPPPPPPPPPTMTPGCGMEATGAVLDGMIEVNGAQRTYLIEIPPDYDPNVPYPLIFGFHGRGGDGMAARNGYRLSDHYEGQAIVVYPDQGAGDLWNTAGGGSDIAFVMSLAEEIGFEMCFDLARVFAFGYSAGGAMAHAVGCHRGDFFRAVGASSGWAPSTALCQGPIAVFMSHGETDTTVAYSQGVSARDGWIGLNGCSENTSPASYEGCVSYEGCEEPVMWCTFDGGHMFNSDYAAEAVELFNTL